MAVQPLVHPATATPIRVGVLGDSQVFRAGVRHMVALDPSVMIVGEGDGKTIRSLLESAAPDILVADIEVEGVLELCREFARVGGRPWVILVAGDGGLDFTVRAVEAGVRGVVGITATAEEFRKAIQAVHAGQLWVRREVLTKVAEAFVPLLAAVDDQQALLAQRLSIREREVARHVTRGLSNQAIAERLGICEATVKAHLTHIFDKLGVRGRTELAARYPPAAARGRRRPRRRPQVGEGRG